MAAVTTRVAVGDYVIARFKNTWTVVGDVIGFWEHRAIVKFRDSGDQCAIYEPTELRIANVDAIRSNEGKSEPVNAWEVH